MAGISEPYCHRCGKSHAPGKHTAKVVAKDVKYAGRTIDIVSQPIDPITRPLAINLPKTPEITSETKPFDRAAYQRDYMRNYMRKRRAAEKAGRK